MMATYRRASTTVHFDLGDDHVPVGVTVNSNEAGGRSFRREHPRVRTRESPDSAIDRAVVRVVV